MVDADHQACAREESPDFFSTKNTKKISIQQVFFEKILTDLHNFIDDPGFYDVAAQGVNQVGSRYSPQPDDGVFGVGAFQGQVHQSADL